MERQLFHKEKKDQTILVIQEHQVAAILYIVYNYPMEGHQGSGSIN